MGLFRNKVGRPSNKTIRNRRIAYLVLSVIVIGLILATSYMLNSAFNLNKVKGATKSNVCDSNRRVDSPTFEITSVDGNFKIGDESFDSGCYIKTDNIGQDLVTIGKNKKIRFRGRFPKLFYQGFWKNLFVFRVAAYGEGDKLIGTINKTTITKQDFEYDFIINENIKYIKADVIINLSGYDDTTLMESVVNVITKSDAYKVSIDYNSNIGFSPDSNGIIKVSSNGDYYSHAIISNENNNTIYYRWFTYKGINQKTSELAFNNLSRTENDFCKAYTDSKILVKRLGLGINDKNKKRLGVLKVYTSKEACENDKNATTAPLASKEIKYEYDKKANQDYAKIYTSGKTSEIIVKNASYDKNSLVHTSKTDGNVVFIGYNGKDVVTIQAQMPKRLYSGKQYYLNYIVYGESKVLKQSNDILIDNQKPASYDVTVSSDVKYVEVKVSYGTLKDDNSNLIYNKSIKLAIRPTVTFTDVSKSNSKSLNLVANADGNFIVNKYQNYNTTAKISNPSGAPIYYRWFTFGKAGAKKEDISYGKDGSGNACKVYSNKEIYLKNLGLSVSESLPSRSGKVKLYANYDDCKKDRTSFDSQNLGYGVVNYLYNASSSNGNNVVIELKDKNDNKPDSKGVYNVVDNKSYYPIATVTNRTNNALYYRWFTYTGENAKEYRYDDGTCYTLSSDKNKVEIRDLENLEVYGYKRSGKLKIYNNISSCNSDEKGTGNSHLTQAIINYNPKKSSTNKGNVKVENSSENLYVLSHIISAEAGGQSYDCQIGVGSVILNRVKSKYFPNTIHDVVFQSNQYSPTWEGTYDDEPEEISVEVAKYLLENGSQIPDNVLYQAGFPQGSGIYKIIDGEYLCYY